MKQKPPPPATTPAGSRRKPNRPRPAGRQKSADGAGWSLSAAQATALAELAMDLLAGGPPEQMARKVLDLAMQLTASGYGYAAVIDPQTRQLVFAAIGGTMAAQCRLADKTKTCLQFNGLWGWVLRHKKPVLCNDPAADKRSSGIPAGHVPINRFLSAPALVDGTLVGQIALANADRHYTPADLAMVERLALCYGVALKREWERRDLQISETTFKLLLANLPQMIFVKDRHSVYLSCNRRYAQDLGIAPEDIAGKTARDFHPPELAAKYIADDQRIMAGGQTEVIEENYTAGGDSRWVRTVKFPLFNDAGQCWGLMGIFEDITARKQMEADLKLNAERLSALYRMGQQRFETEKQLVDFALEEAVRLTGSTIGYFHFLNKDEVSLELFTWSRDVTRFCKAASQRHYPLSNAGVWADCARLKRPVVHNDYPALAEKKGYPEGHCPILRHMSVPVLDADKVVAVAGVANKPSAYDEADVQQLSLFMEGLWGIVKRRRVEIELAKARQELEKRVEMRTRLLKTANDELIRQIEARQLIEAELAASEAKYRTLVGSMVDGVAVIQHGKIVFANPSLAMLLGYADNALIGMDIAELIVPEDRVWAVRRYVERQAGLDVPDKYEVRGLKKDGSRAHLRLGMALIQYGGQLATLATVRDVSAQKAAEEQLKRERDLVRRYLDVAGVMIVVINRDGTVRLINKKGAALLGYEEEEIVGRNWFSRFLPERLREEIAALFGKLISGELNPAEYVESFVVTRQGEERLVAWHNTVLTDDKGRITATLSSGEDITEHRRAEMALRQSRERFQALTESTSDWIWEIDANGRYTYCSPKVLEILGYAPEALLGCRPFDLMPAEEAQRVAAEFKRILETGQPFAGLENTNLHADGRRVFLETSGVPIRDTGGNVIGYRGIDRDVTARKLMEAQATQVRHLASIGELAAGVAHEINNPITGVINYAQILADEAPAGSGQADLARRIIKEGERIAVIVRNLLSFAKATKAEKQIVALAEVIGDSLSLMNAQFRKDGIAVNLVVSDQLPSVMANRQEIQQVVVNLLANARYALNKRYGDRPGAKRIEITAEVVRTASGKSVRAGFCDNGTGIAPETLARIFDPFFSTKPPNEGTGLGLSISYGIVKEHGGRINVESEPGKFTRVVLELPLAGSRDITVQQQV